MNTHLRAPDPPDSRDTVDGPAQGAEKKRALDLSLTQIAGGALAAMTAAALGSTLGVAGTIIGAALASIVAGVAGSLYTASLRTGSDKVRTVFRGSTDAATAPPAPIDPATTLVRGKPVDETGVLPAWDPLPLDKAARKAAKRSPFAWRRAVAVSLSVFALAAVLITAYERVSGEPLSGGTGTTVSQIGGGSSGSSHKAKPPTSTSSSSTPSSEPSSASASAGPGVGGEPSASGSASSSPSANALTPGSSATPSQSTAAPLPGAAPPS